MQDTGKSVEVEAGRRPAMGWQFERRREPGRECRPDLPRPDRSQMSTSCLTPSRSSIARAAAWLPIQTLCSAMTRHAKLAADGKHIAGQQCLAGMKLGISATVRKTALRDLTSFLPGIVVHGLHGFLEPAQLPRPLDPVEHGL